MNKIYKVINKYSPHQKKIIMVVGIFIIVFLLFQISCRPVLSHITSQLKKVEKSEYEIQLIQEKNQSQKTTGNISKSDIIVYETLSKIENKNIHNLESNKVIVEIEKYFIKNLIKNKKLVVYPEQKYHQALKRNELTILAEMSNKEFLNVLKKINQHRPRVFVRNVKYSSGKEKENFNFTIVWYHSAASSKEVK